MVYPKPSPVAINMVSVFLGLITRSVTPRSGRLSVFVVQFRPAFVLFHKPPEAVPAHITFGLPGVKTMQLILPVPPPAGAFIGPRYLQDPSGLDDLFNPLV